MSKSPKELIEESLEIVGDRLTLSEGPSPDSHTAVIASGFDDPAVAPAVARYAVALLAGWVQRNATIGSRVAVQGAEHRAEMSALVHRITVPREGLEGDALTNWRLTWRNAWIAEVVTHMLFVLRKTVESATLAGEVVGLLRPHPLPKRQGLDSVAIYDEGDLAVVAIGETKASLDRGSDELTNACDMFDDVDAGLYGPDLRDAIDLLADVLPAHLVGQVSESLWRDERCYVPAILHETAFDSSARRPRLASLAPSVTRKRVLVLRLAQFDSFFDAVAQGMSDAINEVVV